MFEALLLQVEHPASYTAEHLRRQVVMFCAENPDLILASQIEQIRGLYSEGGREGEQAHPGPFSYRDYLTWMSQRNTWGDQVVLAAVSMMWDVTISIVDASLDIHLPIRHQRPLQNADIVLVYNGISHYNAASKYWYHSHNSSIKRPGSSINASIASIIADLSLDNCNFHNFVLRSFVVPLTRAHVPLLVCF
jgi:hypothetical protein